MTRRSTAKPSARAFKALARKIGDGKSPEEVAEGAIRIAVGNMANAIKTISVQRGYDVTRICAERLRRRWRPACLPRRRRARHRVGADPSALRRALGLWHRARLDQRHALQGRAGAARRGRSRRARRDPRAARGRCTTGVGAPGSRTERRHRDRLGASSLCRHRFKHSHPGGELAGHAGSIRDRASATLRLRQSGQGDRDRGGRGNGRRRRRAGTRA